MMLTINFEDVKKNRIDTVNNVHTNIVDNSQRERERENFII